MGIWDILETVGMVGDTVDAAVTAKEATVDAVGEGVGHVVNLTRLVSRGLDVRDTLAEAAAKPDKPGVVGFIGIAGDILIDDEE